MAAAASQLVLTMEGATTCPICFECYADPRSLPCGHTFCLTCLQDNFTNNRPGNAVPCPLCRREFLTPGGGVQGLPKNFTVDEMVTSIHNLRLRNEPEETVIAGGYVTDGQNYGISGEVRATLEAEEGFTRLRSYIKECSNIFPTSGVRGCRQLIINKLEEWKTVPLNIAVIGYTGVGKSCFINAIRYITADHPLAAGVDVVEKTEDNKAYMHPKNNMLKFWDLPGAGTDRCPKDKYLERIQVDSYDFFLLMITGRSAEIDTWLCQEIVKRRKQFYVVRTQVGRDLYDDKRAHPSTHREEVVLDKMRQNAATHLAQVVQPPPKVFLIDNFEQKKFDFPALERSLAQDFPKLKQQAFVLSMSAFNGDMIIAKATELRASLLPTVVASSVAEPVRGLSVGVDMEFIKNQAKFYFEQLGLDNESLRTHAALLNTSPGELQEIVNRTFPPEFFSSERMTTFIQTLNASSSAKYNGLIRKIIRFLRKLFGLLKSESCISLTCDVLEAIINKTEKVALEVVRYKPA